MPRHRDPDDLPVIDGEALLNRDNIIYVRDRVGTSYEKALAWIAGVGSILMAGSIMFVARCLFDFNERLARIEEKVSAAIIHQPYRERADDRRD